jgi:hypothetical protein
MFSRSRITIGVLALAALTTACSDATSPTPTDRAPTLSFSGGINDSSTTSGGGGGGGGGGTYQACGTLSNIQSTDIVVYTTRTGIGITGTATNCGTRREAFEVDAVDTNPDPYCAVDMPHYIAPRYTDPGASVTWQANSTLVNCQGQLHTFVLTLWDTKTGQVLATTTASAFL